MNNVWKKKVVIAGVSLAVCFTFAGCETQTDSDRGSYTGEIHAYAREEGSGTRAEFEQMIKTTENGAKELALSTREMREQVAEDETAIGYVAFSSGVLGAEADDTFVSAVSVDGIPASKETIKKESYPLCRNYILAYNGELSDPSSDFIRYIKGAVQNVVQRYCEPVRQATSFLSDKPTGALTIRGSSSIAPLMEELAKEYKTYNPNVDIKVFFTDSGDGLTAAIRGECDLAMSSRSLKDYETELLTAETIGMDAIVLIINEQNPISNLRLKEIKKIYDGKIKDWSEL